MAMRAGASFQGLQKVAATKKPNANLINNQTSIGFFLAIRYRAVITVLLNSFFRRWRFSLLSLRLLIQGFEVNRC